MSQEHNSPLGVVVGFLGIIILVLAGGAFLYLNQTEQDKRIAAQDQQINQLLVDVKDARARVAFLESKQDTAEKLKQDISVLDNNLEHLQSLLNVQYPQ